MSDHDLFTESYRVATTPTELTPTHGNANTTTPTRTPTGTHSTRLNNGAVVGRQSPGLSPTRTPRRSLHFTYPLPLSDDDSEFKRHEHSPTRHHHHTLHEHSPTRQLHHHYQGQSPHQSQHNWQLHGRETLPLKLYDQYVMSKQHSDETHISNDELDRCDEDDKNEGDRQDEYVLKSEVVLKDIPNLLPPA